MIELVPWMLFLVSWHPDEPAAFDLRRHDQLFASQAACEAEGANRTAGTSRHDTAHDGATIGFRCIPVPAATEYEALFAQFDKARRQEAMEMQKNSDAASGEGQ